MIKSMTCAVALLALATAVSAQPVHDSGHDRHQHTATSGVLALQLNDAERWATDESLRTGMAGIRTVFKVRHAEYDNDAFGPEEAAALATTVEERVDFMIANCELPPAADAELHKLLAAALAAADTLRTGADPHAGLHRLHQVLDSYGTHFDHPGWDG
ncbi:MAG: hypothetical protein WD572_11525 [Gammaproteobacteria bacterium]